YHAGKSCVVSRLLPCRGGMATSSRRISPARQLQASPPAGDDAPPVQIPAIAPRRSTLGRHERGAEFPGDSFRLLFAGSMPGEVGLRHAHCDGGIKIIDVHDVCLWPVV